MLNRKVIVRGDRSGVFFGTLTKKEGTEVTLEQCRRLWYWSGADHNNSAVVLPSSCKL